VAKPQRPLPTRTDTSDRLTAKQVSALHVQRSRLALDDDTYRRALTQYRCQTTAPQEGQDWPAAGAPCTSSLHLSRRQARTLITRWSIAGAPVGGPYTGSRRIAQDQAAAGLHPLPTPAQRALIGRLIPEVAWRTPDGYRGWLAARLGLDPAAGPRSYAQAEAIIEGLKGLLRHGHGAA